MQTKALKAHASAVGLAAILHAALLGNQALAESPVQSILRQARSDQQQIRQTTQENWELIRQNWEALRQQKIRQDRLSREIEEQGWRIDKLYGVPLIRAASV